jgi:hypothetical protein
MCRVDRLKSQTIAGLLLSFDKFDFGLSNFNVRPCFWLQNIERLWLKLYNS